jgi:hypothetical protein
MSYNRLFCFPGKYVRSTIRHQPRLALLLGSLCCLLTLACATPTETNSPPQTITDIGSRLHLFVDESLIASKQHLALRLHQPLKSEIALQFDAPWEGANNHFVTVFQDGPLYRMYYRAVPGIPASSKDWLLMVAYAESNDGIHWTKPNLDLVEFQGNKQNNIIWRSPESGFGGPASNFAAFKDTNPNAPPEELYKATGGINDGLFLFVSPDSIRWKQKGTEPMLTKQFGSQTIDNAFDSQNCFFWDSEQKQYVGYIRSMQHGIRGIRRTTSPDFVDWSFPEWIDLGDTPMEHFYTAAISPYFRAPHLYVGFPMRYLPDRNAVLPEKYKSALGGTGLSNGLSDSAFISSRDGVRWRRTFDESFIRPGLGVLNWTDRSNAAAWGLVPTSDEEMSLYVVEHYRLPTARIRRRVLRTDGFASVHAGYQEGEFVTKPLVFDGRHLVLNYSTSAAGSIRVEVQDTSGNPIPDFRLQDSTEIFGDSIDQTVEWEQGSDLGALASRSIRLRFAMKDADLYSIRFAR